MGSRKVQRAITAILLGIFSLTFLMPFAWMLSTSFKHESRIFTPSGEPPQWLPTTEVLDDQDRRLIRYDGEIGPQIGDNERGMWVLEMPSGVIEVWPEEAEPLQRMGFHWENYPAAFGMIDFTLNLRNTLFICTMAVIGTVLSSSLVAYSFARIPWRGRNVLFVMVLATMMMPYQVVLIPLFVLYRELGWTGTFLPLIVPYFLGVPFYIFLLRQFFMSVPQDLSAAARIDGCSEFGIYARIIMPLSKPALATCALFMFLFQWGDFLNPLIYLQDDRQWTLALALQSFQSNHESAWGPLMAMSTVITLPIIVLFFLTQRTFIEGITMSGLKG